jgi:hypothetical protein
MSQRVASTRIVARTLGRRVDPPRLEQKAVNRAMCGYFDAARLGDSQAMLRSVSVIASAGEQQVQFAMRFVQRLRGVSRGDLLGVLIGDEIHSPGEPLMRWATG